MSQKLSVTSQTVFWIIFTAIFISTVSIFREVLLPFVIGAIVAYLLNPLVRILGLRGIKRWLASLLILGGFIISIAGLLTLAAPFIYHQVIDFADNVPAYIHKLTDFAQKRLDFIERKTGFDVLSNMQSGFKDEMGNTAGIGQKVGGVVAGWLLIGSSALIGFFTTALLIPIAAFFMMKDWPRITGFVHNLIPKAHKNIIISLLDQIDRKLAGFIRGQLTVCVFLAISYAVILTVAGLKYGALIGIITGTLSIIPFVGSTIGLVTSLGVAALQTGGDWTYVATIAAIFFSGQFVEGNFITPKIIGDKVGLHPLWIIFALLAGASLLGLVGMLIAVPVAAIISVLLAFMIKKYKNSDFYKTPEAESAIITETASSTQIEVIITEK